MSHFHQSVNHSAVIVHRNTLAPNISNTRQDTVIFPFHFDTAPHDIIGGKCGFLKSAGVEKEQRGRC